jgi:hypothetical protein
MIRHNEKRRGAQNAPLIKFVGMKSVKMSFFVNLLSLRHFYKIEKSRPGKNSEWP